MAGSIELKNLSFAYEEAESSIFKNISLELPGGLTTLTGQNGTGKSTFLLLAGGRLLPTSGDVLIGGINSRDISDEAERNSLVSFVYQNMEFETEEPVGDLLPFVQEQGGHNDPTLVDEMVRALRLEHCLGKKFQENSKGDMQKLCIAFSLLYGSPYTMMDEPVFALENEWKERTLEYIKDISRRKQMAVCFSIHELDLSRKYSDNALLFYKDHTLAMGPADAVLSKDYLEEAYQVPMELLYQRESLFREQLCKPVDLEALSGQNVKVVE
ncbi:MAG: ABC transporter ATP-binding protein [Spirochaetales bacterium]|nr:ABC transporter ATP-binding protein [Spirochaetales bacterium]